MKFVKSALLTTSLIWVVFLGQGCSWFSGPDPVLQPNRTGKITQTEVEMVKAIDDEMPKGLAYLKIPENSEAIVLRGDKQLTAPDNMAVYAGDQIIVNRGEVFLIFPDAGASKLIENTTVTVLPDGDLKAGQGIGALIILESGKILSRFERILGLGEKYSIEADNVVATVRGTAFSVSKYHDDVQLQVAESRIQVATRDVYDFLNSRGSIPPGMGWELSAGSQITLKMEEFKNLAKIDPLPEGSFAGFDAEYYFESLFLDRTAKMENQALRTKDFNWMTQKFAQGFVQMPREPYYWSAIPVIDEKYQDLFNPDRLEEWRLYQIWLEEHQEEIRQAEAIKSEMQSEGMFAAPAAEASNDSAPSTSPGSAGPADEPPESIIYYDENGYPHFTDEALGTGSGDSIELLGVPAE